MSNGDLNWIANFIWGIADEVLRDIYVRGKYRDVILPMVVVRRLDAVLESTKQAVLDMKANLDKVGIANQDAALRQAAGQAFYNTSRFTLRDLRARANRQTLAADFGAYLDGYSDNVQEILTNFEVRNQIPRLSKADALGTLIEKFLDPAINLSPNPVLNGDGSVKLPGLDNHAMGTIFEELVRRFNEENNEEAGEHWTPRDAVRLMARLPDGTEGYEGTVADGFRPARNRILWTGDAGMGASLDDMIAWERHIDAARDDETGLYRRLSAPVAFADGAPARYGFGLGRGRELERAVTGHGGGLRGWRSHRLHLAAERLSVVVLFNHLADAHAAAVDLLAAALDVERPERHVDLPPPPWLGAYVEPETGLLVRLESAPNAKVKVRYGAAPAMLDLNADGSAGDDNGRLRPLDGGLWMDLPGDNQSSLLRPCPGEATPDIAGRYRCAELDAELTIADAGGALYGGFSGFLGRGRMELLEPVGPDLWALPCPRALDHTPPGDWTVAFTRDDAGRPVKVEVGCWLARRLTYARID